MASPVSQANRGTPGGRPQQLGRYEVVGRLAAGGMAEVLLGRVLGPHEFERPVAVKRILPHLVADRAFIDMFVNEARIAANIRHARVVQVHELVEVEGEYFLVMEYVEGENLGGLMRRLWLRREALDRALAAHIIAEACAGLHAAHELADVDGIRREVIHRDVSPQNLMITYGGEVKVLDFGIAKASDSSRTQAGQVKGKCEYMSPEQCRGEPLDRGTDIFSLGVVLYELTVGRRLFKRDNALLAFEAVCHAPIPRPTEVDPTYPAILEPICLRALARDRRDRYATMLDMRRDLVPAIRSLAAEARAGEEELLAELMARLFADRIQEKRDMLRQARTQSAVEHIPVAEVDAHVELPEVPPTVQVDSPAFPPMIRLGSKLASAPPRSSQDVRRRRHAIAAALGAIALGGVGVWLGRMAATSDGSEATAPVESRRVDAPAPASPPAPTPAPAPAPRLEASPVHRTEAVSVVVESVPPGAEVVVAGQHRGTTPCTIELPRGDEAVVVAVSLDGFNAASSRLVPTADQKVVLHMQRVAAAPKPKQAPSPSTKPSKEEAPVFERFD